MRITADLVVRWVVALAVCCAGRLGAQEPSAAVLGNDDAEFARELGEAGYLDLATGLCAAIERGRGVAAEELAAARALRLDLRLDAARREKDPGQRRAEVTAVLTEKLSLLEHAAASPEAEAIRNSLPDVYQLLGESLVSDMERQSSPEAVGRIRSEGVGQMQHAEELTKARIAALATGSDDVAKPEGQWLLSARYALPRIQFFHARLYPAGNPLRDELLQSAVELFQELGLDYSDTLINYEAMIYCGLCLRDLGRGAEALEQFDSAIALREQYARRGAKGGWVLPADALDIIAGAVIQKVALLREEKQAAAMAAAVDDYAAPIENAWSVPRAVSLLGVLGDGLLALGDADRVRDAVARLRSVAAQHGERWAEWKARDLEAGLLKAGLAGTSAGDPTTLLRAAGTLHAQKEPDRALRLCRAVIAAVRGSGRNDSLGAEAWMLAGVIEASCGRLHEASVAYDALAQECGGSPMAPEALWRAANCYLELHAREQKAFYARRMQDRIDTLVTRYPNSEPARKAALLRARQLEEERDYAAAYALYLKVQDDAPGHAEAQYRAGGCLVREVRQLVEGKRHGEAHARAELAELQLRKALTLLSAAAGATMDTQEVANLQAMEFGARVWLANLFLTEGVGRPEAVEALFAGLEPGLHKSPERSALAWSLRMQALVQMGRLEDAWTLYQSTRQVLKDASGLGAAARVLARALDVRAVEQRAAGRGAGDADEAWRRAAALYQDCAADAQSVSADELDQVGTRLLVIGLHFARVPQDRDTFIGWQGTAGAGDRFLAAAAETLAATVARSPAALGMIKLGQAQAYLGRWHAAAASYARLFDGEALAVPGGGRLDPAVLKARPELLMAWLEWGAAERTVARLEHDRGRHARCLGIFDSVLLSFASDSRVWWLARCEQIAAFLDQGEYETADVAYQSVLRTQEPATIARFGCTEAFAEFGRILADKVRR